MKKRILSEGFAVLFVALMLFALTVYGSVFDYEIAKAVYIGQLPSDNPFGIIFAFIGIIPTFVGWSFLGASIFYLAKKQVDSKLKRRWLTAFSVLLFVLSFFYFPNTLMMVNAGAFSVHFMIAYPIGIAVIILAGHLGYRLSKRSENTELLKRLLFLAAVSVITMVVVMSTKEIMSRPRFRFAIDNAEYFRSWWESGKDIKASLSDTLSDEFSSFPSGHSAYSMFAIFLFPSLADFMPKLKKYRPYLFILGLFWWVATAFSRMTVGAHYLSDVTIAALITLFVYAISVTLKVFINKS